MFFIMGLDKALVALAVLAPCSLTTWAAAQMHHVAWHGLHIIDCVFPTFLYVAGLSFPFSYAKQVERGDSSLKIHLRLFRRAALLVFFGLLYNGLLAFQWGHFRYGSVLGHIGISWFVAALLFVHFKWKARAVLAAFLLVGYWALVRFTVAPDMPPGTDPLSLEGNIVGYVDRMFMPGSLWEKGTEGMFKGVELMEPSGFYLENVPSVVTALLGMFVGEFVRSGRVAPTRKPLWLAVAAVLLLVVGLVWSLDFPINKKLWSSTFVLVVGGLSTLAFAFFHWLVDICGCRGWCFFFEVIGVNSITIYLAQRFIPFKTIDTKIFGGVAQLFGAGADFVLSLGYILICWAFLLFLYRKHTFLKV